MDDKCFYGTITGHPTHLITINNGSVREDICRNPSTTASNHITGIATPVTADFRCG